MPWALGPALQQRLGTPVAFSIVKMSGMAIYKKCLEEQIDPNLNMESISECLTKLETTISTCRHWAVCLGDGWPNGPRPKCP